MRHPELSETPDPDDLCMVCGKLTCECPLEEDLGLQDAHAPKPRNETGNTKCLHLSCPKCHGTGRIQHGHNKGVMCVHMISCKCRRCSPGMLSAACPQPEDSTTAPHLTQEEIELREEAANDWYDEREREWSLLE